MAHTSSNAYNQNNPLSNSPLYQTSSINPPHPKTPPRAAKHHNRKTPKKNEGRERKSGGEGFHSCCWAAFPLIAGFGCTPSSFHSTTENMAAMRREEDIHDAVVFRQKTQNVNLTDI